MASSPKGPVVADEQASESEAAVPGSLFESGAHRFWTAVILTGLAAGAGAGARSRASLGARASLRRSRRRRGALRR